MLAYVLAGFVACFLLGCFVHACTLDPLLTSSLTGLLAQLVGWLLACVFACLPAVLQGWCIEAGTASLGVPLILWGVHWVGVISEDKLIGEDDPDS